MDVLERESEWSEIKGDAIDLGSDLQHSLKNLAILQRQDIKINLVIQKLENNKLVDFYMLEKEILFRHDRYLDMWQEMIPECLTDQLVDCNHSKLGHPGVYKTTLYLRQFYYWKSMNKENYAYEVGSLRFRYGVFFEYHYPFSTGFTPLKLHFDCKPTDQMKSLICYPKLNDLYQDAKITLTRETINRNFEK